MFKIEESSSTSKEFGFPSTHALAITSVFFNWFLIFDYSLFYLPLFLLPSLVMAFSRYYCGLHSITDILGGIAMGTLVPIIWKVISSRVLDMNKSYLGMLTVN